MSIGRFELTTWKGFTWKPTSHEFRHLARFYYWFNLCFVVWAKR